MSVRAVQAKTVQVWKFSHQNINSESEVEKYQERGPFHLVPENVSFIRNIFGHN